jgi:hypothetical protein
MPRTVGTLKYIYRRRIADLLDADIKKWTPPVGPSAAKTNECH